MSNTFRATDRDMPRGMEVLDAYVARRGPVTLTEEQMRVLIGRAASMVMSASTALLHPKASPDERRVGLYVGGMGGSILATLGVEKDDSIALLRQMHADLERIDPESAP
jgi:hypothetical protein